MDSTEPEIMPYQNELDNSVDSTLNFECEPHIRYSTDATQYFRLKVIRQCGSSFNVKLFLKP